MRRARAAVAAGALAALPGACGAPGPAALRVAVSGPPGVRDEVEAWTVRVHGPDSRCCGGAALGGTLLAEESVADGGSVRVPEEARVFHALGRAGGALIAQGCVTQDLDGGTAVDVPVARADGRPARLAFVAAADDGEAVFVADPCGGGAPVRVSVAPVSDRAGVLAVAPDGGHLAYVDAAGALRLVDLRAEPGFAADGVRAGEDGVRLAWPAFSPDGTRLAAARGPRGNRDVMVYALDGGEARRLTSEGDDVAAAFLADGRIAFVSNLDMFEYRLYLPGEPGAEGEPPAPPVPVSLGSIVPEAYLAPLPDGRIAAVRPNGDVAIADPDAGQAAEVTFEVAGEALGVAASPVEARLAVAARADGDHDVLVADADGRSLRTAGGGAGAESDGTFDLAGGRLAFVRDGAIVTANPDGAAAEVVTGALGAREPRFFPAK